MRSILPFIIVLFACLPPGDRPVDQSSWRGRYLGQQPPGEVPVLFAPGYFDAAEGYHSAISFSPDLMEMVWTPMERDGTIRYARMENDVWTVPRPLNFGFEEGVGEAVFSPDGARLWFVSWHSPAPGVPAMERIWFAERRGDGWSEPRLADPPVSDHPTHWTLSVARSGNLFFVSEREGVRGEQDIWSARWADGAHVSAQDLGPAVNSEGKDLTPCVDPEESFLVFARVGDGTRKTDLYVSFRRADGAWTDAVELGPGINSDKQDLAPYLSPDGNHLFFVSNRAGEMQIYWVSARVIGRMRSR